MQLIDDEGNLFGDVNVIDALVVLLVLAAVAAAVALVTVGGGQAESELQSVNATLDLGTQPDYIVEQLNEGDSYAPSESSELTVTDISLSPSESGTQVSVRARLVGPPTGESVRFDGAPPRLGRSLGISTNTYVVNGTIREVGGSNSFTTNETTIQMQTTLSASNAASLNGGETVRVAGRSVATIDEVVVYDTGNQGERVAFVTATLQTRETDTRPRFGTTAVRQGATITLPTDDVVVTGQIQRVGGGFERGTTQVFVTDTVSATEAESITEGDSYSVAGQSVATVTSVTAYGTDGPNERRVYVGLSLQTLETTEEPRFGTISVREGATIPFQTPGYELSGTVQRVGGEFERETTQVLVSDTVSATEAESITEGDSYSVAGQSVATVTSVTAYGTGDPDEKLVYLGLDLITLRNGEQWIFGTTTVQEGATVPFETAEYELSGTVQRVDSDFDRTTTQVLVSDTVSATEARAIEPGDSYRVAGNEIATITGVTAYGTNNPDRKLVYVGLNLTTIQFTELPRFGQTSVREGVTIPFETPEYEITGTVERVEATEQRGRAAARTVTLRVQNVQPELAQSVEVGGAETTAGQTVARITDISRTSSSVILTSQDGNIYERDHPVNQELTLEANLSVRETTTGTTFKGNTIQRGSRVTLDLGDVTIRATVVSL